MAKQVSEIRSHTQSLSNHWYSKFRSKTHLRSILEALVDRRRCDPRLKRRTLLEPGGLRHMVPLKPKFEIGDSQKWSHTLPGALLSQTCRNSLRLVRLLVRFSRTLVSPAFDRTPCGNGRLGHPSSAGTARARRFPSRQVPDHVIVRAIALCPKQQPTPMLKLVIFGEGMAESKTKTN